MAALKAGGFQTFFQTGLDTGQATNPSTDHCHLLNHAGEDVGLTAAGPPSRYTGKNWSAKKGRRETVVCVV